MSSSALLDYLDLRSFNFICAAFEDLYGYSFQRFKSLMLAGKRAALLEVYQDEIERSIALDQDILGLATEYSALLGHTKKTHARSQNLHALRVWLAAASRPIRLPRILAQSYCELELPPVFARIERRTRKLSPAITALVQASFLRVDFIAFLSLEFPGLARRNEHNDTVLDTPALLDKLFELLDLVVELLAD